MNFKPLSDRAFSLAIGLLLAAAPASAQTQIYPKLPAVGGSYIIVVVSDGYAADESWKFERAVDGLVLNGLMADAFYSAHGAAFTIHRVFRPQPTSGQSEFGIRPNYNVNSCYIDIDPGPAATLTPATLPQGTTEKIEAAVKALSPIWTVVVGNYEGVSMGCRVDSWTFVSAGAREMGGVLEHEFGHLIGGLGDEYALMPLGVPYPTPPIDGPNCSTVVQGGVKSPSWSTPGTLPQTPTNPDGCLFFATGVYHAYNECRMHSADAPFCAVCAAEMELNLAKHAANPLARVTSSPPILMAGFFQQAQPVRPAIVTPPAQTARIAPAVRLMVEIVKPSPGANTGATARVTSIVDVTTPLAQNYRRVGDYVYGIVDGASTVMDVTVLPGDPFQRRAYGGTAAPHRASDDPITKTPVVSARMVVVLPNMTRAQLATREVHVLFYRLDSTTANQADGTRASVTPAAFGGLLAAHWPVLVDISAADLRAAALNLP